jgi:hypothetical protein
VVTETCRGISLEMKTENIHYKTACKIKLVLIGLCLSLVLNNVLWSQGVKELKARNTNSTGRNHTLETGNH